MSLPMQADARARRGRRDGRRRAYRCPWCQERGGPKSYHSFLKHYSRRLMRRWAKVDPEQAPRRPYYSGYET